MTLDLLIDYVRLQAKVWREHELTHARRGDLRQALRAHDRAIVLENVLREAEQQREAA